MNTSDNRAYLVSATPGTLYEVMGETNKMALSTEAKVDYIAPVKEFGSFNDKVAEVKLRWMFRKKRLLDNYFKIKF